MSRRTQGLRGRGPLAQHLQSAGARSGSRLLILKHMSLASGLPLARWRLSQSPCLQHGTMVWG